MAILFLSPGETYGFIGAFETTSVFGTNDEETVYLQTVAKATFDPSFNRGGDELIIDGLAANYDGQRAGSSLLITDENGTDVLIPVGSTGSTITFDDGSYTLAFTNGNVMLGEQIITTTAADLDSLGAPNPVAEAFVPEPVIEVQEVQAEAFVPEPVVEMQSVLLFLQPGGDSGTAAFG